MPVRALMAAALVGVAFTVAACGSGHATMRERMQAWATAQGFAAADAQVVADLDAIGRGVRRGDLQGVHEECVGLSDDLDQVYAGLPAPDRSVTAALNSVITRVLEPAAEHCYAAPSLTSAAFGAIHRALVTGRARYDATVKRVAAYGIKLAR